MIVDLKMKQRIIGIVVLVAIALFFVPWLLDHLGSHPKDEVTKQQLVISAPDNLASLEPTPVPEAAPVAASQLASPTTTTPSGAVPPSNVTAPAVIVPSSSDVIAKESAPSPKASDVKDTTPANIPQSTAKEPKLEAPAAKAAVKKPISSQHKIAKTLNKQQAVKHATRTWAVQLGSFSSKTNANKLAKNLHAKGFSAYVDEYKRHGTLAYRVLVGKNTDRNQAIHLQKLMQGKLNIHGIIISYGS